MAAADSGNELGFGPGELLDVARRRLWWMGVPMAAGVLISGLLALFWPAEYEAAAIIGVYPQAIPTHLVVPTVGTDTEAAFSAIRLEIMARNKLSEIIDDLALYPEMQGQPREFVIREMRSNVSIEPLPPVILDPRKPVQIESFRIAFRDDSAKTARDVANRLTTEFQAANLDQRAAQAEGTSEFILSELRRARTERQRVGGELSQYKQEHRGELPEDLLINQQRLERLSGSLEVNKSNLETARGQVAEIQRELDQVRESGSDGVYDPARRKKLVELEISQQLALGKTEKHPDLLIARSELIELDALIAKQGEDERPSSPAEANLIRELRGYTVRADVLVSDVKRAEAGIVLYEERIVITPRRGAEIAALEAQYESLTVSMHELQGKQVEADMGRAIELSQKGEKFRVVEAAVVPAEPISPNRPLFVLVGSALGLLAGLSLVALREMADNSFYTVRDLQTTLGVPVLGTIPAIEAGGRPQGLRRWIGTGVFLLASLLGGGVGV